MVSHKRQIIETLWFTSPNPFEVESSKKVYCTVKLCMLSQIIAVMVTKRSDGFPGMAPAFYPITTAPPSGTFSSSSETWKRKDSLRRDVKKDCLCSSCLIRTFHIFLLKCSLCYKSVILQFLRTKFVLLVCLILGKMLLKDACALWINSCFTQLTTPLLRHTSFLFNIILHILLSFAGTIIYVIKVRFSSIKLFVRFTITAYIYCCISLNDFCFGGLI